MKPNLRWMPLALLLPAAAFGQTSYIVTNAPGWNLIANQLDSPNGNNVRNVIPSAPISSTVRKFNLTTKGFDTIELFTAAGGWLPGTNILNPGDGLVFSNASAANFNMTFSGNPHVPVLPLNLGPNPVLVARQTNALATITNILGYNPPSNTIVYQFITGPGHDPSVFVSSNYNSFALKAGGAWNPSTPGNIPLGISVWVTTNGSPPSFTSQPKTQDACPGSRLILTATAGGSAPLTYQWTHAGTNLPGVTTTSYTIPAAGPADAGNYTVVANNPLGTATSSNATIRVGDFLPPDLVCPSNIVTGCRGTAGTTVSFTVGISDNCDGKPTLIVNPPSGSVFPPGTTVVTATGYDASGNTNTCTFTVTVADSLPPLIKCPDDMIVAATGPQGAKVSFYVSATDNCDPNPIVISTPASGSLFPIGLTTVASVAKDVSGNSATCAFDISVVSRSCCVGKYWRLADVTSPGGRYGHAMAYDPARARVVLFGGTGPNGLLGDTWEWNGTNWLQVATVGPSPRYLTAMAYDDRIQKVVLFGGSVGSTNVMGDTWVWDGSVWTPLDLTVAPSPRGAHAMAYDSSRGRLVLYGGFSSPTAELGDTWEFNGGSWKQIATGSTTPGPRDYHVMAYGSAQNQLLLFGGARQGSVFGDTWLWDGTNWNLKATSGPAPRAFAAMAYNDNCDAMVLFGGFGTNYLGDTWEWDGAGWTYTFTNNPSARIVPAMAHDTAHNLTVLYGGTAGGQSWLSDTRLYGLDQNPPAVLSTYAACGDSRIVVAFSKPLDPVSAQNPANYVLSCGGVATQITQVILTDDPRIVWLVLAEPFNANPLTGGCCVLLISGVRDSCGHLLRGYQTTVCCTTEPCTRGSAGTEFWLTFPGNYAPDPTNPPTPQIWVAGAPGIIGAVSIPGLTAPFSAPFAIPAGGVATVTLPPAADLGNANDLVQSNAIHVTASAPVTVYGMNHIPYTTDAYLGLSTRGLGQSYFVMSYQNNFNGVPELNGSQFAIAAAQDNTTVIIVPSYNVGPHPAGVPFNLTMNRGQTYQLRATNDFPADLTGTIIVADQPIAVFGSHQCANIPNSNTFFCDYIVEQLPPTELWGFNFITTPLVGRSGGDTFRVMGMVNGTTVTTNGVAIPGLLNRGKFVEIQLAVAAQIAANAPVLVAQMANSSDYDMVSYSDPFMVLVPPTAAYSSTYTVEAPTSDFAFNYINVMAPLAAVGQINLDGTAIAPGGFVAVGGSGYAMARVFVGAGPHRLFSSNSVPFGVITYGWNLYDSYGYPGGTCNVPQGQTPRFTCPGTNYTVQAGAGCLGVVPDLTTQVGNGNSAVLILQQPPAGTLLPPGTYPVTITIIDAYGQRHLCPSSVTVTPGSTAGLLCPREVVTNCMSLNGQTGQFVFFSVGVCNTNFGVSLSPPSGSFFPSGTTIVTATATNAAGASEKCVFPVTVNCVVVGISQTSSNVVVTWAGNGVLQKATAVTGPWITLSNTTSPYRIAPTGGRGFFRVAPSP